MSSSDMEIKKMMLLVVVARGSGVPEEGCGTRTEIKKRDGVLLLAIKKGENS